MPPVSLLLPESRFPLMTAALSKAIDAVEEVCRALEATDAVRGCEKQRQRLQTKKFRIAACALMKSGKSTLLSCLTRAPLFPEDLLPATATICDTTHNPDPLAEPSLRVDDGQPICGAQAIFDAIEQANNEARETNGAPSLQLSVHLPLFSRVSTASVDFVFADTPGYNEAGSAVIQRVTNRQLADADVLLYVFDISKIGSEDEEAYITQLVLERPDLVRDGRLVLAMNKMDLVDEPERAAKFLEAKAFVVRCVERVDASLGDFISNDAVFVPTISKEFLLADCALSGTLPMRSVQTLKKLVGGRRADRVDLTDARVRAALQTMVAQSGVLDLEAALAERLCAAPTLFCQSVIGQLLCYLDTVHQLVVGHTAAVERDATTLAQLINVFKGAVTAVEAMVAGLCNRLDQEEARSAQSIDDRMAQLRTDRCDLPAVFSETREFASHEEAKVAAQQMAAMGSQALNKLRKRREAEMLYDLTQHISLVFSELSQRGRAEGMRMLLDALQDEFPEIATQVRGAFPDPTLPVIASQCFDDGCVTEGQFRDIVEGCQARVEREVTERVGRVVQPRYKTSNATSDDVDADGIAQGVRFLATGGAMMPLRTVYQNTTIQLEDAGGIEYDDVQVRRDVWTVAGPVLVERLMELHRTHIDDLVAHCVALRIQAFSLAKSNLEVVVLRPATTILQELVRHTAGHEAKLNEVSSSLERLNELQQRVVTLKDDLRQAPCDVVDSFAGR